MKHLIVTLALALAAGGAWAQTTEDNATETEQSTETSPATDTTIEETGNDEQFPVAEDQETDGPQEGQGYLKAEHGNWEVRCIRAPEGQAETCRLYYLLVDNEGASVAEFNLSALPNGGRAAAGVDVATPLGSLLTKDVTMQIDSGKANRYRYTWCDQLACYARFGLTQAESDGMKRGANAKVTVWSVAAPEEAIELQLSLTGFTAAWNDVAGG
ncbi:MAG: invasion associated locus B family protein [Pseudomonadota bacterium]